jgi:hypothetical protein
MSLTRLNSLSIAFLLLGILALLSTLWLHFTPRFQIATWFKTGLTERDAVLGSLKKNTIANYSFQTNFTPGLGYVTPKNAQSLSRLPVSQP